MKAVWAVATSAVAGPPKAAADVGDFVVLVGEGAGVESGTGREVLRTQWQPRPWQTEPALPQQQQHDPPRQQAWAPLARQCGQEGIVALFETGANAALET